MDFDVSTLLVGEICCADYLSDLSWMAYQYQTFGFVTKSMLLVTFFHFLYVLDFFYNEDWYLRTMDITHDHFGFYLAWGDTAFLPNRESSANASFPCVSCPAMPFLHRKKPFRFCLSAA